MKRFLDVMYGIYTPYYNADDGGGEGGNNGGGDDKGGGDGGAGGKDDKTFTQAELDRIVTDRLERERKKYADYDDAKAELARLQAEEEQRKKDAMSEAERLKAEKEEADRKAQEEAEKAEQALKSANKRVIDAEIRSIARALNAADPNDVLALLDKSEIKIDEEGNVTGVEDAVKAFKEAKPHLFKSVVGADAGGGSDPGRNPNKSTLAAKEKEYEELRAAAVKDRSLLRKLNALYHEIQELKTKK